MNLRHQDEFLGEYEEGSPYGGKSGLPYGDKKNLLMKMRMNLPMETKMLYTRKRCHPRSLTLNWDTLIKLGCHLGSLTLKW